MIDDNAVAVKISSYIDFKLEDKRKLKNKGNTIPGPI